MTASLGRALLSNGILPPENILKELGLDQDAAKLWISTATQIRKIRLRDGIEAFPDADIDRLFGEGASEHFKDEEHSTSKEQALDESRKSVDRKDGEPYTVEKWQYEQYQSVLRDICPGSYEEFQKIKKDPAEWEKLQKNYKVLDMYKVDSGEVSAKDILWLDERALREKRDQFTSGYKRNGNIAVAYIDGDKNNLYFAHSRLSASERGYNGNYKLVLLDSNRRFIYKDVVKQDGGVRQNTFYDTEAKLFEYFANLYETNHFKSITMISERGICESCKDVMRQFKEMFPGVAINVVSNKSNQGTVWKGRT